MLLQKSNEIHRVEDAEKLKLISETVMEYYRQLGEGDIIKGVEFARDIVIKRLIDTVLKSEQADSDLKDRAFFTRASLDFLNDYSKIINGNVL